METKKNKYTDSIARHINSSGKSQKEIVDELQETQSLKVSQSTISGIINGERDPKLSTVVGLASLFGISIDELVGYTPRNPAKSLSETRLEDRLLYLQNTIRGTVEKFKEWTPMDVADYVWQQLFIALSYNDLCEEEDEVILIDSWSPECVTGRVEHRPDYSYGVPITDEKPEE